MSHARLIERLAGAGGRPKLFSIDASRPFLRDLASFLLETYADDPAALADAMVFLPTRRAVRALADAFLASAGDSPQATLLPRIRALGDIGEDDLPVFTDTGLADDLPPPVSSLERRLVLARFIYQKDQWQADELGAAPGWPAALAAATELGRLLDSFYTEQVAFEKLEQLVPERFAVHWQVSLNFLEVVTKQWPAWLEAQGKLDPADHRRQLIDALEKGWNPASGGKPPAHPVIIAGSTGSMPAVARLMCTVADLPRGAVVLPSLDRHLDEVAWRQIEDPHPQAGLRHLLTDYFNIDLPAQVHPWPVEGPAEAPADAGPRQKMIALALRPAEATDDWRMRLDDLAAKTDLPAAAAGLSLAEMDSEADEAMAIAIAMRSVLEEPGRTAMLVTPERTLARRVSARLKRWGINLDDSAGVPFANTLRGNFLRLVAAWLVDVSDPTALLALLKHPLCTARYTRPALASLTQTLDLGLRGLRPAPGFDGLRTRFAAGPDWDALEEEEFPARAEPSEEISQLIDTLEEIAAPYEEAGTDGAARLAAHLACAEALCTTPDQPGAARLWAYEDGEAGASLIDGLYAQSALLPSAGSAEWPALFEALTAGVAVRTHGGTVPRLVILGPLEARLQQADLVILGGLNEGVWPDETPADAFLSRGMRRQLGLPSPERRIGLAAHDFAAAAAAPQVLLTRARRSGRAPTKPSRWIIRLRNILNAASLLEGVDKSARYKHFIDVLDGVDAITPAEAPRPCPPVASRPVRFSATGFEKLMRDPYSIYARDILRLRPLEPIDATLDAALRGRFYHALFARFAQNWQTVLPENPQAELWREAEALYERGNFPPVLRAYWHGRLGESIDWFCRFHESRLKLGRPAIIEGRGVWEVDIDGTAHALSARADRIDQQPDGFFIYDYKTGKPPTLKQTRTFSPQLQVTALISINGGFDGVAPGPLAGFGFVKVVNRKGDTVFGPPDDVVQMDADAQEGTVKALIGLTELLRHYQDPQTPYLSQPRTFFQDSYGDYDHLARRAEWATGEGGSDD